MAGSAGGSSEQPDAETQPSQGSSRSLPQPRGTILPPGEPPRSQQRRFCGRRVSLVSPGSAPGRGRCQPQPLTARKRNHREAEGKELCQSRHRLSTAGTCTIFSLITSNQPQSRAQISDFTTPQTPCAAPDGSFVLLPWKPKEFSQHPNPELSNCPSKMGQGAGQGVGNHPSVMGYRARGREGRTHGKIRAANGATPTPSLSSEGRLRTLHPSARESSDPAPPPRNHQRCHIQPFTYSGAPGVRPRSL